MGKDITVLEPGRVPGIVLTGAEPALSQPALSQLTVSRRQMRQGTYTYEGSGLIPIAEDDVTRLPSLLRRYEIDGEDGRYWTDKLLRHIMTRDRVRCELNNAGYSSSDIDDLVDRVHPPENNHQSKSYLKVFALLLLQRKGGDLAAFVEHAVCDKKLPIMIEFDQGVFSSKDQSTPLKCFDEWDIHEQELFEVNQWCVLTPFFGLTAQKTCQEFELTPRMRRPWRKFQATEVSDRALSISGTYGTVTRVEFHPTSHSFRDNLNNVEIDMSGFAIKALHSTKSEDEKLFRQEFDQLNRFSGFVHPHLVTTLGAFKHGERWSFIFPGAHCDLDEYLEQPNPPWTHDAVHWAFKQLLGITGALDTIHNPGHLHLAPDIEKRYGRHGDIKCDNILCFRRPAQSGLYHLVISDFGISAFNRDTSRSNIPNGKVPGVPGYRPPECDVTGGKISRAFDVWTLGCLFLEFITWLLGGPTTLEAFRSARVTTYRITGVKNNIFYVLNSIGNDRWVAQVKPEVTDWIQRLRKHENCSQPIHDVLDMIQQEMLILEDKERKSPIGSTGKRSSSKVLRDKLNGIHHKCTDKTYCIKGLPRGDQEPLFAPAVEVELNSVARLSISERLNTVAEREAGRRSKESQ